MKERLLSAVLLLLAGITVWLIAAELPKKEYATPAADFSKCDNTTSAPMISDEVIRLHILADSDTAQDQKIKLILRDTLLPYLNAATVTASSKSEALSQLKAQCGVLTELANQTLEELGVTYTATVSLTTTYFPIRIYGSQTYLSADAIIFPPGYYDSVQIILGSGEGHNWGCLAYPSLCFIDSTYDYIPKNTDLYQQAIGTVKKSSLEELFYGTKLTPYSSGEASDNTTDEVSIFFGSKLWELFRNLLEGNGE